MGSDTVQPDHAGLQAVEETHAPEVVESSRLRAPLERRSSLQSPEAFAPHQSKEPHGYFHESSSPGQDARAYYAPPPGYDGHHEKQSAFDPEPEQEERRIWGVKRNLFFILVVVLVIVIIAAVVGGVCGGVLGHPKSNKSTSPPPSNSTTGSNSTIISKPLLNVANNSGVALLVPASSSDTLPALYSYYQRNDGALIELLYNSSEMSISSNDTVIPASNAASGTPLAATSWVSNGHTTRALFYIDGNGRVMTTNTTGTQAWSPPYNILTGDSANPNTNALCVVSDTAAVNTGLDGIRVYYGSGTCPNTNSAQCIREVGMDFSVSASQPVWNMWATFPGSDVQSGVACAISNNINHMYLRNTTTNVLAQWQWNYPNAYQNGVNTWTNNATGSSNITSGSDIAVATDGSTDSIFYQTDGGVIERALYFGSGIEDTISTDTAATGTKLSSAYVNGTAMVFYQRSGNASIWVERVTRGGTVSSASMVGQ